MKSTTYIFALGLFAVSTSACSAPGNLPSTSLAGGGVGAIAGYFLGENAAETGRENTGRAIGAGLGVVSGAIAGGIVEKSNQRAQAEALPNKRVPEDQDRSLDREIDRARRDLDEKLNYGRSETKTYEERYRESESHLPYQGH